MNNIVIDLPTVQEMEQELFPDRNFSDIENKFYVSILNKLSGERISDNVTAISARCGLGKSTILQMLVYWWQKNIKCRGLIIVTDNLNRLSTYKAFADPDFVAYLTAENKETEIKRQQNCPVLLMSTQRYFCMDNIDQFLIYKAGGYTYYRDTIIFDETPYFYTIDELRIDEINLLHTALSEGIPDTCNSEDKSWILEEYANFREKMIEEVYNLEAERSKTTYLYWDNPNEIQLSSDINRFSGIFDLYENDILSKYPGAKTILENITNLLLDGGIFQSVKLKDNEQYQKGFILRKDNRNKFYHGNFGNKQIKTYILDATAKISQKYPIDSDWIEVIDCDNFEVPLDYLNVHIIDVNTSRNALINQDTSALKIEAINKYIRSLHLQMDDSLLVTYKQIADSSVFPVGFPPENILYFGNTRGYNSHNNKHNIIQIGNNRQSDINYLIECFYSYPQLLDDIYQCSGDSKQSIRTFDRLLNNMPIDLVDDVMCAELATDTIQNIFRTKARDIHNQERVDVYLFYSSKLSNLTKELQYWLGRLGAKFTFDKIDDLDLGKLVRRKVKKETNTQKIVNWINSQPNGRIFTSQEMRLELGLSQNQFNNAKDNNYIKRLFHDLKIAKSTYQIKNDNGGIS